MDGIQGGRIELLRRRNVDPATGRQWPQAEVAYRMRDAGKSVSPQQIGKWESGEVAPGAINHLALARALGCSMEDLFAPLTADEAIELDDLRTTARKAVGKQDDHQGT